MKQTFVVLCMLDLFSPVLAHNTLSLQDPSIRSGAAFQWVLMVLSSVALLASLGLLLGNLGRNVRLVFTGAGVAVLSAGLLFFSGKTLWQQQSVPADHIILHHSSQGWDTHYGLKIHLSDTLVVPTGTAQAVQVESEQDTRLHIPMLGIDLQLAGGTPTSLTFNIPTPGTYLALDGKLNIKAISSNDFQAFLKGNP